MSERSAFRYKSLKNSILMKTEENNFLSFRKVKTKDGKELIVVKPLLATNEGTWLTGLPLWWTLPEFQGFVTSLQNLINQKSAQGEVKVK
jgi:hypothetical protein